MLVSGTDGVGTKLRLAMQWQRHDTIGIDLVGMCVNDVIVQGAEPLFFLDYFATGKLDNDIAESVIEGIANGCRQAGAALIGGETAEMPGMYQGSDYDLAGFCVGVVERDRIIDGSKVNNDDVLIGVASSGPHSNGYSLVRKIVEQSGIRPEDKIGQDRCIDALLAPTRIYVKPLLSLFASMDVHALSHITGGGLTENLPRVLPANTVANIDSASWSMPAVFDWLQEQGNIEQDEMYRTFNCGVGMVVVVSSSDAAATINHLNSAGESAWQIGKISHSDNSAASVEIR